MQKQLCGRERDYWISAVFGHFIWEKNQLTYRVSMCLGVVMMPDSWNPIKSLGYPLPLRFWCCLFCRWIELLPFNFVNSIPTESPVLTIVPALNSIYLQSFVLPTRNFVSGWVGKDEFQILCKISDEIQHSGDVTFTSVKWVLMAVCGGTGELSADWILCYLPEVMEIDNFSQRLMDNDIQHSLLLPTENLLSSALRDYLCLIFQKVGLN